MESNTQPQPANPNWTPEQHQVFSDWCRRIEERHGEITFIPAGSEYIEPEPIIVNNLRPPLIFEALKTEGTFKVFRVESEEDQTTNLVIDWAEKEKPPRVSALKSAIIGSAGLHAVAQGVSLTERGRQMNHAMALRSENLLVDGDTWGDLQHESLSHPELTISGDRVLDNLSIFGVIRAFEDEELEEVITHYEFNPAEVVRKMIDESSDPDRFITESFEPLMDLHLAQNPLEDDRQPTDDQAALRHILQLGINWLAIEESEITIQKTAVWGKIQEQAGSLEEFSQKIAEYKDEVRTLEDLTGTSHMAASIIDARQKFRQLSEG